MKKLVFVSTPFRAATDDEKRENIRLAQRICRKVWHEIGIPFAPHLLFPQFLDDADARQREEGINAGIEMLRRCDVLVFSGRKVTDGMALEMRAATNLGIPVVYLEDPGESQSKGKKEEPHMYNEETLAMNSLLEGLDNVVDVAAGMQNTNCRFSGLINDAVLKLMTAVRLLSHSDRVGGCCGDPDAENSCSDDEEEKEEEDVSLAELVAEETGYDEDLINEVLDSAFWILRDAHEKEDDDGKDE